MKLILVALFLVILTHLLWTRGFMVVQSKLAVAFIGKRGSNHWGAAFTSCTGYTKRVIPLEKGVQYRFIYDENISDGIMSLEINCGKTVVRKFDKINSSTVINTTGGLYTVTTRFKKASGEYTLKWEKV